MWQRVLRLVVGGFFIVMAAGALWANEPPTLVHLQVKDRAEQDRVGRIINLEERTRGFDLYGWATAEELQELDRQDYTFEVVTEDRDPQALTMCTDPDGPPFEPPFPWDCYPTYGQFLDMMDYWATTYPLITQKVNIGASTSGNHDLWTLKISDNPGLEEDEPEIFYTATMHGDELVCYPTTLHLIDHILQNYGSDPQITALINGAELWINPMANPDGTFNGGDSTVGGSTRYIPGAGVDPNRNFPDPQTGDHPDGSAWAAETVAMMAFADAQSLVLSANCHSGAEVVNYPWDTWAPRHADDAWFQTISHAYADSAQAVSPSGYMTDYNDGITNGYDWYEIDGGRQDYMNYFHGCREVTLELSADQWLDAGLLDDHFDYNRDALLGYFDQAFDGIRGVVTDAVSGDPIAAKVTVVGHDIENQQTWVFNDPDIGDYHRMIEAGTWTLMIEADGYASVAVDSVEVADGQSTTVDVQMEAPTTISILGLVTAVSTGVPIEGATVELVGTGIPGTVTGSDGSFVFSAVSSGAYIFRVAKDGFTTVERAENVSVAQPTVEFALDLISTLVEWTFEDDDGEFSVSGSWQWGTDSTVGAASGSKVWGTVLGSNYSDNADWTLDSQDIVLADDLDSAQLEFAHWYDIELGFDGGQVRISVDDGATFGLLTPEGAYDDQTIVGLDGQPGYTGSSTGWETVYVDLGAYIGQSIIIRWRFGSDGSLNERGWYIDDVKILTTGGIPLAPELFADGFESGDTTAWAY